MYAVTIHGGPAPFREAVLGAVEDTDGLTIEEPSSPEHHLIAVYCDVEAHWNELERVAGVDDMRTVAILTELDLSAYARALSLGADGVVHADTSSAIIASVVRSATLGETVIPTFVAQALAATVTDRELPRSVTPHEREMLAELRRGARLRDLADRFSYSERTIRRQLQSLFLKVGATNRAEAISYAATHDIG